VQTLLIRKQICVFQSSLWLCHVISRIRKYHTGCVPDRRTSSYRLQRGPAVECFESVARLRLPESSSRSWQDRVRVRLQFKTRIVQLPATAAIEYVAACCRTRTRTRTKTRTKTKIGTITKTVLGAYARSPQVQCIYAPSRLSVPSILA